MNTKLILPLIMFLLCFLAVQGLPGAEAATLFLSPAAGNAITGTTFSVDILLDTSGQKIDGVDAIISYNPVLLEVQDGNASASGIQISAGSLMPIVTYNSVNTASGKILFSQVANPGTNYTGSGTLATISFRSLSAGSASVSFYFSPGNTTDSNVAFNGTDVLSSVSNGAYTIQGQTVPPTPPPSTSPGATPAQSYSCDSEWQCTEWSICKDRWQTRVCNFVSVSRYTSERECPKLSLAPYTSMRCVSNETNVKIADSCSDGYKNQDEEGIDCGGICKPCSSTTNTSVNNSAASKPLPKMTDQAQTDFWSEYLSRFITYSIIILIVLSAGMFGLLKFKAMRLKNPARYGRLERKTYEAAVSYIEQARSKGVSDEKIRDYLQRADWDAGVVDEILKKYWKEKK